MTDSNQTSSAVSGLGATLLGIAFVVLKLTRVIDWPWIWVTAPFWMPIAVVIGIIAVILAIAAVVGIAGAFRK